MAFLTVLNVSVTRTCIKRSLGGIVGNRVNVAANDGVVRIAEQGLGILFLPARVLSEGVSELHGFALVGGVIDIHWHGTAKNVAVVAPHQHLFSIDVPSVNAIERMEIPSGLLRVAWRVRQVIASIRILDLDFSIGLEPIRAEKKFVQCGEEDVSVFQNAAEGNVVCIRKDRTLWPSLGVVLGKKNPPFAKPERLVASLRIDVGMSRGQAVMKMSVLAFGAINCKRPFGNDCRSEKGGGSDEATAGN